MAILSSTGISGFLSSAKATGKQILNKAGKLIPEYIEDFVSGFAGHGWKIWNYRSEIDSENNELKKYKLEIDSLTVRESMTVFELLIQKIRAVKGALSITQASGKVATAIFDEEANEWLLTVEDEMSFVAHDIIRCQSWKNGALKGYWVEISEIRKIEGVDTIVIPASEFIGGIGYDKNNDDAECVDKTLADMLTPAVGDDIIQFGNTKMPNRQSAVYIHADEGGQPAIDILFGITAKSFAGCVKTRIGGDIPGGDGAKGFYCENGMIKCVDEAGSLIYEFKPDGSFSLGKRKIVYDPTEDKLKFGAGVTLTWDNIAEDAKDNLKGDKGDKGDKGADAVIYEIITPVSVIREMKNYGPYPDYMKLSVRKTIGNTFIDITTNSGMISEGLTLKVLNPRGEGAGKDYDIWYIEGVMTSQYFEEGIKLRLFKGNSLVAHKELPQVADGIDGTNIEYIYMRVSKNATQGTPSTPESKQSDKYIPSGWTDKPQGVTEMDPSEWISMRTKNNLLWSEFSTPALWSNWGEKGMDGDGCEYIYKQTSTFVSPDRPLDMSQTDDYVPEGWTDDPQGVSESLPYEWVCTRKSKNGVWKEFSAPALWAKFGKDGQAGSDADVPDWLKEWDGYATDIGSGYIVTPAMFSGMKNDNGTLTGVAQGNNCIKVGGENRSGIFGLVDNDIVFELDPINKKYLFRGRIETASQGTRVVIDPTLNSEQGMYPGMTIYDTEGEIASTFNGSRIDSIDDLYGASGELEYTMDNFSWSRKSMSVNQGDTITGTLLKITTDNSGVIRIPEIQLSTGIENNNAVFAPGPRYMNHVQIELYANGIFIGRCVPMFDLYGIQNATTQAINLGIMKGVNVITYKIVYSTCAVTSGNVTLSVSVSSKGKFVFVSNIYMSRYFANGFSLGSSTQNFFECLNVSDSMLLRAIMDNYGLNLTKNGIQLRLNGKWYTLGVIDGRISVTESSLLDG